MTTPPYARLPRRISVALGIVVITAFGSWFYGYGVLLQPIVDDTGWKESTVASAYGAGLLLVGVGAALTGRLTDRRGARPVFVGGALGVGVGSAVVATAQDPVVFLLAAAVTQGFVGAVGYYAVVHATIGRLAPEDRARSITVNTLWGAFASPIYLPLVAWLVSTVDWRPTVGLLGASVVVAFVFAAAVLPPVTPPAADEPHESFAAALASTVRDHTTRRLLIVAICTGTVMSILFLYQVPVMVDAGLTLATASTLAGARGFMQLAGRLPLAWLMPIFGTRRLLQTSITLIGVSCVVLLGTGDLRLAIAFVVIAGIATGANSPLESIVVASMIPVQRLGTVLGVYLLVRGIGASLGPVVASLVADATGSRTPALVGALGVALIAALAVPGRRTQPQA